MDSVKNNKDIDYAALNSDFDWGLYKEAEEFVKSRTAQFLSKNHFANELSKRMPDETSTTFFNWIDHIAIPESSVRTRDLERMGFIEKKSKEESAVFVHPSSYLFPVLLRKRADTEVALKPEELDSFLQILGKGVKVEGSPFSHFRKASINNENGFILSAIERRGYDGFSQSESEDIDRYISMLSSFLNRKRFFESDEEGLSETKKAIAKAVKNLDSARVSDAFFRAERLYWERRNKAGQIQKSRQERLGLGWGNQDHHTYRSSRANFLSMIKIFESMGYKCRERYYAGEEAKWGAQILEHPTCNIVVFTDVDLYPEETKIDFAHEGLEDRTTLGTVGLWVGLHGESILQAGMHHLEARFDFDKLSKDLPGFGVEVMPPFSYFEFLKQAFTVGERWGVEKKRLDTLLSKGSITKDQYETFLKNGAIGSHMENLERRQGFKGFNKSSVTKIIKATDPRMQKSSGA